MTLALNTHNGRAQIIEWSGDTADDETVELNGTPTVFHIYAEGDLDTNTATLTFTPPTIVEDGTVLPFESDVVIEAVPFFRTVTWMNASPAVVKLDRDNTNDVRVQVVAV